jgi:hypothetical protein
VLVSSGWARAVPPCQACGAGCQQARTDQGATVARSPSAPACPCGHESWNNAGHGRGAGVSSLISGHARVGRGDKVTPRYPLPVPHEPRARPASARCPGRGSSDSHFHPSRSRSSPDLVRRPPGTDRRTHRSGEGPAARGADRVRGERRGMRADPASRLRARAGPLKLVSHGPPATYLPGVLEPHAFGRPGRLRAWRAVPCRVPEPGDRAEGAGAGRSCHEGPSAAARSRRPPHCQAFDADPGCYSLTSPGAASETGRSRATSTNPRVCQVSGARRRRSASRRSGIRN